ncbi:MAG TPA: hypothetical protein VLK85_13340 [Ramlibacter sp.]|nr:hypothetical protein [Ramlibacter sp.]
MTSVGLSCIENASGVSHTGIAVLDAGASLVRLCIMTRRADEAAGGYQFVGLRRAAVKPPIRGPAEAPR